MKLKIVQPKVEREEEDEIELWLEKSKNGSVNLFSKRGNHITIELKLDENGTISRVIYGNRGPLEYPSIFTNFKTIKLY
jgi:hypothetical protein